MYSKSHNFENLKRRWDLVIRRHHWQTTELHRENDHPVLAIENEAAQKTKTGGFYISAGVHGDECAPVWALLEWAESIHPPSRFDKAPLVILPCLNPHGLVENTRLDSCGRDLNRNFQNAEIPLIKSWNRFLEGRRFQRALNLHEDYDAGGIYLYELSRHPSIGDKLLSACETIIPRETENEVDGSEMVNGLLQRTGDIEQIAEEDLGGWPEAIWLHLKFATDSFTFETPSERDLAQRIHAHRRFIETALAEHT